MSAPSDTNWLDGLARRAVSRESGAPADLVPARGLSRRMLLRLTGAAVLAGGALSVVPRPALAQSAEACIRARKKENQADLGGCLRGPDLDYQDAASQFDKAAAAVKAGGLTAKETKAARKLMSAALGAMQGAINSMSQCNAAYSKKQNESEFNCRVIGPPQPRTPDDVPGQGSVGVSTDGTCPGETFACPGQDGRCCYNGTFCCPCACCIYNDCRCCVGA